MKITEEKIKEGRAIAKKAGYEQLFVNKAGEFFTNKDFAAMSVGYDKDGYCEVPLTEAKAKAKAKDEAKDKAKAKAKDEAKDKAKAKDDVDANLDADSDTDVDADTDADTDTDVDSDDAEGGE